MQQLISRESIVFYIYYICDTSLLVRLVPLIYPTRHFAMKLLGDRNINDFPASSGFLKDRIGPGFLKDIFCQRKISASVLRTNWAKAQKAFLSLLVFAIRRHEVRRSIMHLPHSISILMIFRQKIMKNLPISK